MSVSTMPGAKATQSWVARMKGADAPRTVAILNLLAQRGDAAALPAILEATKHADEKVRVAALNAAGPAGDERSIAPLTAALTGRSWPSSSKARRACWPTTARAGPCSGSGTCACARSTA